MSPEQSNESGPAAAQTYGFPSLRHRDVRRRRCATTAARTVCPDGACGGHADRGLRSAVRRRACAAWSRAAACAGHGQLPGSLLGLQMRDLAARATRRGSSARRSAPSIARFCAASDATSAFCCFLACASCRLLRWSAARKCLTCPTTLASSDVTLLAASIRDIMSSRLLAPRITSSVEALLRTCRARRAAPPSRAGWPRGSGARRSLPCGSRARPA